MIAAPTRKASPRHTSCDPRHRVGAVRRPMTGSSGHPVSQRRPRVNRDAAAYWIARSSRAMTGEPRRSALPRPACGERVGVRGTLGRAGLADSPPHPKPSASTSPPQRGGGGGEAEKSTRGAGAFWGRRGRAGEDGRPAARPPPAPGGGGGGGGGGD